MCKSPETVGFGVSIVYSDRSLVVFVSDSKCESTVSRSYFSYPRHYRPIYKTPPLDNSETENDRPE
jgi:hypothetical protein